MPIRKLSFHFEVDRDFVAALTARINSKLRVMDEQQRAICILLLDRLTGKPRQMVSRTELNNFGGSEGVNVLRREHCIPIISSPGAHGGFWLPSSMGEAKLVLRSAESAVHREINRLIDLYAAMRDLGMGELAELQPLETVLKIKSFGQEDEVEFRPPQRKRP